GPVTTLVLTGPLHLVPRSVMRGGARQNGRHLIGGAEQQGGLFGVGVGGFPAGVEAEQGQHALEHGPQVCDVQLTSSGGVSELMPAGADPRHHIVGGLVNMLVEGGLGLEADSWVGLGSPCLPTCGALDALVEPPDNQPGPEAGEQSGMGETSPQGSDVMRSRWVLSLLNTPGSP
ncbi:hypothetical protein, partial [Streptomyces sp. NPDC056160]|uniref:hypothetical protein n=1 Tax=Streptomyces sp. NPDC056160 TaxID=3345731 RepID=UPI0035D9FE2E